MPRESVLTAVERTQIRIEKLIFHIILKNELQPRYLNEVTMTGEQRTFFATDWRMLLREDNSCSWMILRPKPRQKKSLIVTMIDLCNYQNNSRQILKDGTGQVLMTAY